MKKTSTTFTLTVTLALGLGLGTPVAATAQGKPQSPVQPKTFAVVGDIP